MGRRGRPLKENDKPFTGESTLSIHVGKSASTAQSQSAAIARQGFRSTPHLKQRGKVLEDYNLQQRGKKIHQEMCQVLRKKELDSSPITELMSDPANYEPSSPLTMNMSMNMNMMGTHTFPNSSPNKGYEKAEYLSLSNAFPLSPKKSNVCETALCRNNTFDPLELSPRFKLNTSTSASSEANLYSNRVTKPKPRIKRQFHYIMFPFEYRITLHLDTNGRANIHARVLERNIQHHELCYQNNHRRKDSPYYFLREDPFLPQYVNPHNVFFSSPLTLSPNVQDNYTGENSSMLKIKPVNIEGNNALLDMEKLVTDMHSS